MGRTFGRMIGRKKGTGTQKTGLFFPAEREKTGRMFDVDSATCLVGYLGGYGKFKV